MVAVGLVVGNERAHVDIIADTIAELHLHTNAQRDRRRCVQFVVVDAVGTSQPANVVITIAAVDDAPVATDAAVTRGEDASVELDLIAADVESADLVYAITQPTHGVLLVYTPQADLNGTDTFAFTVDDGTTISAPATVTSIVTANNDAPLVAAAAAAVTGEDVATAAGPAHTARPALARRETDRLTRQ